ncbi:MAG: hypothetical protein MHM6MM_001516 [Cercozoa sp. M6MM]
MSKKASQDEKAKGLEIAFGHVLHDSDDELDEEESKRLRKLRLSKQNMEARYLHEEGEEEQSGVAAMTMDDEMATGYFDDAGNFHEDKEDDEFVRQLDAAAEDAITAAARRTEAREVIEKTDLHKSVAEQKKQNSASDETSGETKQQAEEHATVGGRTLMQQLRFVQGALLPNEAVKEAIIRLSGGSRKQQQSKKKAKSNRRRMAWEDSDASDSSDSEAEAEREKRKQAQQVPSVDFDDFSRATAELANHYAMSDIYDATRTEISRRILATAEAHERKQKQQEEQRKRNEAERVQAGQKRHQREGAQEESDKKRARPVAMARFHYKWKQDDKAVHGPFNTKQLLEWKVHFKNGIFLRKVAKGEPPFVSSLKLDFDNLEASYDQFVASMDSDKPAAAAAVVESETESAKAQD